ncbi:60S acidic ribosomal protein P0 [Glycine soja]|uniref:60S acidic ribosomal protein P0 n=1 Tax=Glycine soja TaxID=3848 RepID=A0A445FNB3_GLYSO|nr:60S acidic ribosomal protein P0 [Glycine soja]
MAVIPTKAEKKVSYDVKLCQLLEDYTQILVVAADNVGSNQLENIRKDLRGDSVCNLKEVSEEVARYKLGAPARVGLVAPIDVAVPPGNTGLDPSQTSFFQINKGTVEIITPVELIKKGDKVGPSEAVLLYKLAIRPFSYGLVVVSVYDNGSVFSPEVLDLTEDDLIDKFSVAAPHMFGNAYKNVLAVAVATEYSFPEADKVKEYLKVFTAPATASKEEEKKEEPAEESDDDMGFSLFD